MIAAAVASWLLLISWNAGDLFQYRGGEPYPTFAECIAAGKRNVYYGHGAPIRWRCRWVVRWKRT